MSQWPILPTCTMTLRSVILVVCIRHVCAKYFRCHYRKNLRIRDLLKLSHVSIQQGHLLMTLNKVVHLYLGSIVGPQLINVLVNDMFHFMEKCDFNNYADDNSLSVASYHMHDVLSYLSRDCRVSYNGSGTTECKQVRPNSSLPSYPTAGLMPVMLRCKLMTTLY